MRLFASFEIAENIRRSIILYDRRIKRQQLDIIEEDNLLKF